MASILYEPQIQFIDYNGNPLVGGKIYTYEAGTSNLKETWRDANKTQLNTNPVILDDSGRAPIWIEGIYKIEINDSNDQLIYTMDDISSLYSGLLPGLTASIADLNSTTTTSFFINADYNLTLEDRGKIILANAFSTPIYVDLLPSETALDTYKILIKKVDLSINPVIIRAPLDVSIDEISNEITLYDYNDFIEIACDASNWHIVASQIRGTSVFTTDQSTNIDLEDNNKLFLIDASLGDAVVNLPLISSVGKGFKVTIKKQDDTLSFVTIVPGSPSETIDRESVRILTLSNPSVMLQCDDYNWYIMSSIERDGIFTTGDIKETYKLSEPGWLLMGDTTIGNAGSGADFADITAKNLYKLLWNNIVNTWCPVTGGRGSSAEDDFNAGKPLALPKQQGRAVAGVGTVPTEHVLGEFIGQENHQLLTNQLPIHRHAYNTFARYIGMHFSSGSGYSYEGSNPAPDWLQYTGNTGAGIEFSIIQPVTYRNFLIKL